MAAPTQYSFDLAEVAKALVKEQNIHEGKWMIAFEFTVSIGVFGANPTDTLPGGMIQIRKVLLAQPSEPLPPAQFIIDAKEVNPLRPERTKRGSA